MNIGRGVKSWAVAVVLALILTIEVQGLTMMNGQVKVRMVGVSEMFYPIFLNQKTCGYQDYHNQVFSILFIAYDVYVI